MPDSIDNEEQNSNTRITKRHWLTAATAVGSVLVIGKIADMRQKNKSSLTLPGQPIATDTDRSAEAARQEIIEKQYQAYLDQIWLLKKENETNASKLIITLSSTFLAASIAFIKDVTPLSAVVFSNILFFSWASFAASILCILSSYFTGVSAGNISEGLAERYYRHGDEYALNRINKPAIYTNALNIGAAIFFVTGLFLSLLFVIINFKNELVRSRVPYHLTNGQMPSESSYDQSVQGNMKSTGNTPPSIPPTPKTRSVDTSGNTPPKIPSTPKPK